MPSEPSYQSTLRPEDFAPQPGFKLGIVSILVYLAGVLVHFFVYGGLERVKAGGATAGVLIGGYVVVFLLAILVSYLAFAIARSRVGATVVFCLSIPALIFGAMKVNGLADAKIRPEVVQATPAPAAPAAPGTAPAATPVGNPSYSETQRGTYVDQAGTSFINLREVKKKAYIDAGTAYNDALKLGASTLTSKEAIAARRQIIANLTQANQDYLDFITNQEATYRGELEKTPLVPNDVNNTINRFKEKNPFTADAIAARLAQRDALKANDDMIAMLDSSYGRWKLVQGKLVFQKQPDSEQYGKLHEVYEKATKIQNDSLLKYNNEQKTLAAGNAPPTAAEPTPPSSPATGAASPEPVVSPTP